ncbi:MAG TPA: quinolinate synthase NadA [Miltoncostaeaceae bacterium]|nr:quinolinate synthase NadA [Miltoncostaeaceae bacterium]
MTTFLPTPMTGDPECSVPTPAEQVDQELRQRAWTARRALGSKAVILGHHYQKHAVIEFADVTGDSFLLAQRGAERTEADHIIFLGVYFMAEAADLLRAPHQTVVLPDLSAGCHLAECADIFTVRDAWSQMTAALPGKRVIPLTYMNSGADLKAFVGEHGGAVCTSGNAVKAFEWAFSEGDAVFFFPDEHLGRNTIAKLGVDPYSAPVWDARKAELGGIAPDDLAATKMILWKGFCNVHTGFTPAQIAQAREEDPDVRVIVHPECPRPVVEAADEDGSTQYIIRRCEEAPSGASLIIGTDLNLVDRLRLRHPDKNIRSLNPNICPCVTQNRIDLPKLTACMEALVAGDEVNVIRVEDEMRHNAKLALDRMLALA